MNRRQLSASAGLALLALVVFSGCASNGERIDAIARASSLERSVIEVDGFHSVTYLKRNVPGSRTAFVFLEGDGRPWTGGITPNADPTTGNPLALELLIQTPRQGVYVARPCYQTMAGERCSPALWTSARYSEDVVRVMTATIRMALQGLDAESIVLVGHSGGGVLAVLVAERMPQVTAVVTIAANLDTDAWTTHHGYLPLSESLNPALSTQAHPWREIHIAGRNDAVVTRETTSSYFDRYPSAEHWLFDEHGHVCCWTQAWPQLWERLERELEFE